MTGDRGNDRDNRKIIGLGCPGRNIYITTRIIVQMQRETIARMFNEIQEHNFYRTDPDLLTLLRNVYLFTDSSTN